MAPPRKRAARKNAVKKKPTGSGGGGTLRGVVVVLLVALAAFGVGVLSGLYRPHRLFASSTPPPTARSSAHVPPPHAVTDTQPAGAARRAEAAAHAEASPSPHAGPAPSPHPAVSPSPHSAVSPSPRVAASASPHVAVSPVPQGPSSAPVATAPPKAHPSGRPVAMVSPPAPRPSAVADARAAIIIDDCGNNNTPIQTFLDAPAPVTLAVLPHLTWSRQIAERAHEHGKGVMLHFPMEASGGQNPGPGTLRVAMSDDEKRRIIKDNLAAVPDLQGVNNHEGSKATTDAHTMDMVLNAVNAQNLFWVDSVTTPNSCAYAVAERIGIPFARRDIFLDNVDEIEPIKTQMRLLIKEARAHGSAIGIGHARTTTATAFVEMIPAFEEAGVKLVLVRDLTRVPQPAKEEKR